ncbi:Disintegrin and metalloproteinase domain-containing protein 5 [Vulpes lagopus]
MFLLLVLLARLGELHAGPNPHKTFLQTTVPEKISSSDAKRNPENNIAYVITIKGKPYFVHLKKQFKCFPQHLIYCKRQRSIWTIDYAKSFLSSVSVVYFYDKDDIKHSKSLLAQLGTLQLKNISYGIEPMEAISGFVHMIYEEKLGNTNIPLLGENRSYSYDSVYYYNKERSQRTEFFKLYPQNLEMYIIVDKNLFDYMGSDIKAVTQKVIQIIGFVNTIFQKYPSFIGATFPGKICNKNFAVGVALYPEGLSLESYTVSIVQLLGFNLGLSYDDPDICYCSGDVCTMSRKAVQSGGVKEFSTCNLDDFKYLASHSGFECLQNILPEIPVYKQRQKRVCGNGILEEGEQCDCGTIQTCTHKACCDPRSCVIKTGKQCGSGECCTLDCKLRPGGIPCRKSLDECDFTEYCNGVSSHCVPDTYARNGQSCESGDAFCYEGRCRTANKQCKKLIGGASRGGSFACYDEINSRSDRYGNCGRDFCSFSNLLCGKLVCAWPHKALVSRVNLSVIYSHVREEMCVSTYRSKEKAIKNTRTTYETPEDRDDTFVQDGTVCGPAMYCINFSCVEIQYQINTHQCNSSYCNSHGVCNNLHHCHCEQGFAPPRCLEKKGEFGSIDDGHKAPSGKSNLREGNTTPSKHQFQLIFYISLPVLIITAVVLIKHKKIRELCYRGETESERSMSEESSSNSKLSPSVSHGVCNNLHHCHCEQGFAPPRCLEKKGEFGSIDDGHKAPSGLSTVSNDLGLEEGHYQISHQKLT